MNKPESPYNSFRFVSYEFDRSSGEVFLRYAFDDVVQFEEKLFFEVPEGGFPEDRDDAIDRALFGLHLIGGISYYKAYCPSEIKVESGVLSKKESDFWNEVYTRGLGEFFYQNNLSFKDLVQFPFSDEVTAVSYDAKGGGRFVPIGGGKDSLVTIEKLKAAGKSMTLFSLKKNALVQKLVEVVDEDQVIVERKLDATLFDLNEKGAYNGHIPISAYIAFLSVFSAIIYKKKDIILSNEQSANFGNVVFDGVEINHQYSKSLDFERSFQNYVTHSISPDVHYFSLLRPYSELKITQLFSAHEKYFSTFTSCNRNFKVNQDADVEQWCCQCPKCAFVFAMLAAFVSKEKVVGIFKKDLFDQEDLLQLFKDLMGGGNNKPFDCVGEPGEVIAAFSLAHERGDFEDSFIMKWFVENVLPKLEDAEVLTRLALVFSGKNLIPKEYQNL